MTELLIKALREMKVGIVVELKMGHKILKEMTLKRIKLILIQTAFLIKKKMKIIVAMEHIPMMLQEKSRTLAPKILSRELAENVGG